MSPVHPSKQSQKLPLTQLPLIQDGVQFPLEPTDIIIHKYIKDCPSIKEVVIN